MTPTTLILISKWPLLEMSSKKRQLHRALGARTKARMLWLDKGDKGSKFFFNILKQKQCKERIDKLWVDEKEIAVGEEILSEFSKFYKQLFSSEDSPTSKVARIKCKDLIPKLVSPDEVISLSRPFLVEEIIRAINSLHNDKAPGPDGLTI